VCVCVCVREREREMCVSNTGGYLVGGGCGVVRPRLGDRVKGTVKDILNDTSNFFAVKNFTF